MLYVQLFLGNWISCPDNTHVLIFFNAVQHLDHFPDWYTFSSCFVYTFYSLSIEELVCDKIHACRSSHFQGWLSWMRLENRLVVWAKDPLSIATHLHIFPTSLSKCHNDFFEHVLKPKRVYWFFIFLFTFFVFLWNTKSIEIGWPCDYFSIHGSTIISKGGFLRCWCVPLLILKLDSCFTFTWNQPFSIIISPWRCACMLLIL